MGELACVPGPPHPVQARPGLACGCRFRGTYAARGTTGENGLLSKPFWAGGSLEGIAACRAGVLCSHMTSKKGRGGMGDQPSPGIGPTHVVHDDKQNMRRTRHVSTLRLRPATQESGQHRSRGRDSQGDRSAASSPAASLLNASSHSCLSQAAPQRAFTYSHQTAHAPMPGMSTQHLLW